MPEFVQKISIRISETIVFQNQFLYITNLVGRDKSNIYTTRI